MKAVENHKKWVDAAAALGCHAIRINTGEHYSPTDVTAVAEACGMLTDYGAKNGISVICENHGGPSSNPDALIALMKAVGKPTFGTLPDFGNFPHERDGKYTIDVYDAIARMMPYAKGVSAKSYDFDESGKETKLDFARIMKIVTDAGYHGFVGIEYEGSRLGEPEGIRATKKLLRGGARGARIRPANNVLRAANAYRKLDRRDKNTKGPWLIARDSRAVGRGFSFSRFSSDRERAVNIVVGRRRGIRRDRRVVNRGRTGRVEENSTAHAVAWFTVGTGEALDK